jgi:hypothetical protein
VIRPIFPVLCGLLEALGPRFSCPPYRPQLRCSRRSRKRHESTRLPQRGRRYPTEHLITNCRASRTRSASGNAVSESERSTCFFRCSKPAKARTVAASSRRGCAVASVCARSIKPKTSSTHYRRLNWLAATGRPCAKWVVPDVVADRFLQNHVLSPRYETVIVEAMKTLRGIPGRTAFIQYAARADTEDAALLFQEMAELLAGYHRTIAPIRRLDIYLIPLIRMTAVFCSAEKMPWNPNGMACDATARPISP